MDVYLDLPKVIESKPPLVIIGSGGTPWEEEIHDDLRLGLHGFRRVPWGPIGVP